jgi:nucleotidyltransferase/DNA polymerase involved in DNA repair
LQAALRHQEELAQKPIGLIDGAEKKAVIIQINPTAEEAGVRIGMTPSQGLARSLDLIIKGRSQAAEKILQDVLLDFAGTLSPYVEATGPGLATVQFTDLNHVAAKVRRVVDQLEQAGVTAQAGVAPTPDASFLAANLARPVLQIDNATKFLAELPIEVLALG